MYKHCIKYSFKCINCINTHVEVYKVRGWKVIRLINGSTKPFIGI